MAPLPRLRFEDENGTIEFEVIPKKREAWSKEGSRVVGMTTGSGWAVGHGSLLNVLEKKGNRYGQLELPFMVAVNTLNPMHDEEVWRAALFGETQEYVCGRTGELRVRHLANGLWGTRSNPKYTRISGVLLGMALPWNVPRIGFCLYLNPWAALPLLGLSLADRQKRRLSRSICPNLEVGQPA